MPRGVEFTFRAKLGKPHKNEGNLLIYVPKDDNLLIYVPKDEDLLIYVPKDEAEIFALNPGDYCEVTLKVLTKPEAPKT
jgi:hypothetical protein